jgi:hypothetical protein
LIFGLAFTAVEVDNFRELIKEIEMRTLITTFLTAGLLLSTTAMAAEGKIQRRKERQQQRIGEGVENGKLTPKETAHLEHKEAGLNKQIRQDRKANGGKLTGQEKTQISREQNRLSKNIYKTKHDGTK